MKSRLSAFLRLGVSLALAAVPVAALAAPVCVDPGSTGGIGGTGAPQREGGIGGTGSPTRSGIGGTGSAVTPLASGGIGGTGAPASDGGVGGTGIVGTITGFASICVNGVEVHYGDSVPVSENGRSGTLSRLAIGQVVAVEAGLSARGLEAREISILHAYEGPVTALPSRAAPLQVMGRPVALAPAARVDKALRVGEFVRVSGFRNARGEVVATRVERAPKLREASAIGRVERAGSLNGLALAGASVAASGETLVRGRWNGRALSVTKAQSNPSTPFAGRVREAIVEGLVLVIAERRLEISGFTVELDATTTEGLVRDSRVRVHGRFTGTREIRAGRVEFVREAADGAADGLPSGRKAGKDEAREQSGKLRNEPEKTRLRIEKETGSGRERERVERRIEGTTGESRLRERVETRERPESVERVERVERIDRVERVERPERVERLERLERPERIERLDHD